MIANCFRFLQKAAASVQYIKEPMPRKGILTPKGETSIDTDQKEISTKNDDISQLLRQMNEL